MKYLSTLSVYLKKSTRNTSEYKYGWNFQDGGHWLSSWAGKRRWVPMFFWSFVSFWSHDGKKWAMHSFWLIPAIILCFKNVKKTVKNSVQGLKKMRQISLASNQQHWLVHLLIFYKHGLFWADHGKEVEITIIELTVMCLIICRS